MTTETQVLPQELTQRGFIQRDFMHAWLSERVFREETEPQTGLKLIVWAYVSHGRELISVTVDNCDDETTATIANSYNLADLLPTIDAMIAICENAPFVSEADVA